jgi:hypothetical protein
VAALVVSLCLIVFTSWFWDIITFRGILDNFSGFMYRFNDTAPRDGVFTGEFLEIKRLSKNWYWTATQ